MKVKDKVKIQCYKHNGQVYQSSNDTVILDIKEDYIVCANKGVDVVELDDEYKTKELAIIYFYKNNWFNVIAQLKPKGLYYYANIATPFVIDEDVIKYIDYDLDLRVYPDGAYKVLDKNEYKYHRRILRYPKEIDVIIKYELNKLINMKKNKEGPFNKSNIEYYKNKYEEMENKGII